MRRSARCALLLTLAALPGCNEETRDAAPPERAATLTGGSPGRGRVAIRAYGCGSCHTIPGVPGADALVGPPLAGVAQRIYIAGVLANTPENMVRWIQDPQGVDTLTAMPNLGVSATDARDIATYLYTLK